MTSPCSSSSTSTLGTIAYPINWNSYRIGTYILKLETFIATLDCCLPPAPCGLTTANDSVSDSPEICQERGQCI